MPEIILDLSYLEHLGSQHPIIIMWELFRLGGWIPLLVVFIRGFIWIWLNERVSRFYETVDPVLLAIDVPKTTEQTPKAVENIFAHLIGSHSSILKKEKWVYGKQNPVYSFEIISVEGYVQFLIRVWAKYRDLVEALIYAQYPEAEITEVEDYTENAPKNWVWPPKDWMLFGTEFIPSKPSAYPIKTYTEFEDKVSGEFKDPISSLLEVMAKMTEGEQLWYQMIIQTRKQDWQKKHAGLLAKLIGSKKEYKESVLDKIIDLPVKVLDHTVAGVLGGDVEQSKKDDKPARSEMLFLSPGEKYVVEKVEEKLSKVGFETKIRFVYFAPPSKIRVGTIVSFVRGFLQQYTTINMNKLGFCGPVTTKYDYFWQKNVWPYYLTATFYKPTPIRVREIFNAYKMRSTWRGAQQFVMSTEELASLWHFPSLLIKTPTLKRTESKRAEPPITLPTSRTVTPDQAMRGPSESSAPKNLPT